MKKINDQLSQLGFTDKEADIYLALLELGSGSIVEISKKSGIKRTTVYEIINSLLEKSLIAISARKQRKVFIPINPSKLLAISQKKLEIAKSIIPELESLLSISPAKPKIQFYEGTDGLINMYDEILENAKSIKAFVTTDILKNKKLENYIWNDFTPARIKKKILLTSIGPDNDWMKNIYKKEEVKYLRKVKLIPKEKFPFSIETLIYDKFITIISFEHKLGVTIESKDISHTWGLIHDLCWTSNPL